MRSLPYNTNVTLVDVLERGVRTDNTNELQKRIDLMIQTISEFINYSPSASYACCYAAPNFDIGLWSMSLINAYDTEVYLNNSALPPDPRIPVELKKLLDRFYSTQRRT